MELSERKKVEIGLQQRNGRKQITIVSGLSEEYDVKKILQYMKRQFHCNGSIIEDDDYGKVMALSGNQKNNVYHFLIESNICEKDDLLVRG